MTAFTVPQATAASCGEVSPESTAPPVGKENPGRQPASPQHCGSLGTSPYSDLAPHKLWWNLQGSTTGDLTVMEKWGGVCNNQHTDLGR